MQDVPLRCLGLKGIKESALYPGLLKKLIKIGGSPVGKSQVMRYLTLVHPSTKWFNITGKVVQNDRAVGSNASVYTPIWEQIEQAYQFVLRNIHMGATFEGIYRQDVYEIPPDAIRELIINAAVHRSYLDHGNIQIAIYDNRLEITSPCKIPMGQTLERMKEGYSQIRNEALAYAFAYMNLIEHWGSGIPRIIGRVKALGLAEPEFIV